MLGFFVRGHTKWGMAKYSKWAVPTKVQSVSKRIDNFVRLPYGKVTRAMGKRYTNTGIGSVDAFVCGKIIYGLYKNIYIWEEKWENATFGCVCCEEELSAGGIIYSKYVEWNVVYMHIKFVYLYIVCGGCYSGKKRRFKNGVWKVIFRSACGFCWWKYGFIPI